jgi:uncharacterized protein (TIGR02300 family)
MIKAALGRKRKCLSCGTGFFDLRHNPIVCPRCKVVLVLPPPEPLVYRKKTPIPEDSPAHAPEAAVDENSEVDGDDDEDADVAIGGDEPAEELGADILPLEEN